MKTWAWRALSTLVLLLLLASFTTTLAASTNSLIDLGPLYPWVPGKPVMP